MNTPSSRHCAYKTASGRHEWPNRDPIGEAGGINLYNYVGNNPVNIVDPYGEDAYTVGPVTITVPGTTEWWEENSQSAHEAQHRADWLKGYPGQRGFAAEIPVIQDRLNRYSGLLNWMQSRPCRDKKAEQNLQDAINGLTSDLGTAQTFANNDEAAMDYWNSVSRRWYQQEIHPPRPLPPASVPPPFISH